MAGKCRFNLEIVHSLDLIIASLTLNRREVENVEEMKR